jgi:hypothetical protein
LNRGFEQELTSYLECGTTEKARQSDSRSWSLDGRYPISGPWQCLGYFRTGNNHKRSKLEDADKKENPPFDYSNYFFQWRAIKEEKGKSGHK